MASGAAGTVEGADVDTVGGVDEGLVVGSVGGAAAGIVESDFSISFFVAGTGYCCCVGLWGEGSGFEFCSVRLGCMAFVALVSCIGWFRGVVLVTGAAVFFLSL